MDDDFIDTDELIRIAQEVDRANFKMLYRILLLYWWPWW